MAEMNCVTESGSINQQLRFTDLPFVQRHEWDGASCGTNWHMPPVKDYREACDVGREWAELYLEYRRQNPAAAGSGSLASIAGEMHAATGAARGYAAGFFARLEKEMLRC